MESRTSKETHKESVLHDLIQCGAISDAIQLLSSGALKQQSVYLDNLNDKYRQTPLAEACRLGHTLLVKALIDNGADVSKGGLRTRKSVLDYAEDKPEIIQIILPLVQSWVDSFQEANKSNPDKAKFALLAYSLANYFQKSGDMNNATLYFNKANAMTQPNKFSSANYATLIAILGPLRWLLFKFQLNTGHVENAKSTLMLALEAFAKVEPKDDAAMMFEREAIFEAMTEIIRFDTSKLDEDLSLEVARLLGTLFVQYILLKGHTKKEKLEKLFQFLLNLTSKNNPNKITDHVLLMTELVTEHVLTITPDSAEGIELYTDVAQNLQTFARNLDKHNYIEAKLIYPKSNHFLNAILNLSNTPNKNKLQVIKRVNDDCINIFDRINQLTIDIQQAADSYVKQSVKTPKVFLALLRKSMDPKKNKDLYKHFLRFGYVLPTIKKIGGVMQAEIEGQTSTEVKIGGTKLKNLKNEQLTQLVDDCEIFLTIIRATHIKEDMDIFIARIGLVVDELLKTSVKSIEPKLQQRIILDLINKICVCEIARFEVLKNSDIKNALSDAIAQEKLPHLGLSLFYGFWKDLWGNGTKSLKPVHIELGKQIKQGMEFYIKEIDAYPEVKPPIFPYTVLSLLNSITGETEKGLGYLFYSLPKLMESLEKDANDQQAIDGIKDCIALLSFLSKESNFDISSLADPHKILNLSQVIIKDVCRVNVLHEKKRIVLHEFIKFWEKQAEIAAVKNRYQLMVEAVIFVKLNKEKLQMDKNDKTLSLVLKNLQAYLMQALNSNNQETCNALVLNLLSLTDCILAVKDRDMLSTFLAVIDSVFPQLLKNGITVDQILKPLFMKINEVTGVDQQIVTNLKIYYLQHMLSQEKDKKTMAEIATLADQVTRFVVQSANNAVINRAPSQEYVDVLRQAYTTLANWYTDNNQHAAALDCYSTLEDIDSTNTKTYLCQSNIIMHKMTLASTRLTVKIMLFQDIMNNCGILNDEPGVKSAVKELINLKYQAILEYLDKNNLKHAQKLWNEIGAHSKLLGSDELTVDMEGLKSKIDDKQKKIEIAHYQTHSLLAIPQTTKTKIKKPKKSKSEEVKSSAKEEVIKADKAEVDVKKDAVKIAYEGGKVGSRVEAAFIAKGTANLFPVLKKDIAGFKALKDTNYTLYKNLKTAVLEGGICREFGESGIKYLGNGMWEAKVAATKERLLGHTSELDGKGYIVFDKYLPKGFH